MQKITLLYVEDEKGVQEQLSRFLSRFVSTLYTAKNGQEGLDSYRKNRPDIILTDIQMPVMNGIEMAQEIKKITPDQPVVFITAHSDSNFFLNAIDMQVDGYILKPIDLKRLKKKLLSLIEIIELKRELTKKEQILEEVANLQNSLLIVLDGNKKLIFINHAFKEFFQCEDIQSFQSNCTDLSEHFIKHREFYHVNESTTQNWINELKNLDETKRIVSMIESKSQLPKAFLVNIKENRLSSHTLITFVEVTLLTTKTKELEIKAYTDELTQIPNRAKFNLELNREIERFKRYLHPLSLILFDIDHFKYFNDTYGHTIGDKILKELTSFIQEKHIRKTDLFARWGGEEFVVLLPDTDLKGAAIAADELRTLIEQHLFYNELHVTCSFGVSCFTQTDNTETFFQRCDEALYQAKTSGRNRTEIKEF